jgi:hypothetical protein
MQTNDKTPKKKTILKKKTKMTELKYNELRQLVKKQLDFHKAISSEVAGEIQKNLDFLIGEKEWRKCALSGNVLPPDQFQEFFSNYKDYVAYANGGGDKYKRFVMKGNTRGFVKDTMLKVLFSESEACDLFTEKGEKFNITRSHLYGKIETGEFWKNPARITRDLNIYTDFPHYYYDNKKAPKNWKLPKGDTYGIELEVKFPDASTKLKFSRDLYNLFPDWCCERDGSLEDIQGDGNSKQGGLELITPPLLYDDLQKSLEVVVPILKKYNALGHNTGSDRYGLHITHGILKPNDIKIKETSNYIRFVNDPVMRDFWRNFCRREANKYCKFIGNYEGRLDNYDNLSTYTKSYNADNHYNSICMREGLGAIETRLFRSTINPKTIAATIEFVKLANEVCVEKYDPVMYLDLIFNRASRNLTNLLEKTSASLSFEYLKKANSQYDEENF